MFFAKIALVTGLNTLMSRKGRDSWRKTYTNVSFRSEISVKADEKGQRRRLCMLELAAPDSILPGPS